MISKQLSRQSAHKSWGLVRSILLLSLIAGGCDSNHRSPTDPGGEVVPSANLVTELRNVQGFSGVSLNTIGYLFIEQTGTEVLTITAPEPILPSLRSAVIGAMLYLESDGEINWEGRLEDLTYRVNVAQLDRIEVSSPAAIEARGVQTDHLQVEAHSLSSFSISGRAEVQEIRLSGAAEYEARHLASREAVLDLDGASHVTVRVSERLEAHLSAGCSVEYFGDPVVVITGSGSVRRVGS